MDPAWANALVGAVSLLVLIFSSMVGYFFRISREVSELKTYVASYYATKKELVTLSEQMERHQERSEQNFNRLYDLLKNQRPES